MAKKLAGHLFETVRVTGQGRWLRESDGRWNLHNFKIYSYERLDERPLGEVVAELRRVPRNGWKDVTDPYGELAKLRGDDD